jgi:hypothetical protein
MPRDNAWIERVRTNTEITILDANKRGADGYGYGCGAQLSVLTADQLEALLSGKMLAWNDGEYATFLVLEEVDDDAEV